MNTTHILQWILHFSFPPTQTCPQLVTCDVKSLYTNIPHDEGMESCLAALDRHYGKNIPLPLPDLQHMFNFILKSNYLTFNDKFYLQTHGTAMGSSFAPEYANIFLGYLEKMLLEQAPNNHTPTLWIRFIDDILFIDDKGFQWSR